MPRGQHFIKQLVSTVIIFSLTVMVSNNCLAQENTEEVKDVFHPHSQVALIISHAQVSEGSGSDGNKKHLSLPSWGFDYNYWFHPKWAIGLQTDLIVENFEVKKSNPAGGEEETVERSYPVAPALMGIYKPTKHWSFSLGMGGEFAKEEHYALTRIGVEYGAELPKNWEVFGTLSYDFKWNAYDTWVIGIGISKSFGKGLK